LDSQRDLRELFDRYMAGQETEQEREMLYQQFNSDHRVFLGQLLHDEFDNIANIRQELAPLGDAMLAKIHQRIQVKASKRPRRLWFNLAAAASLLAVVGAGSYFLRLHSADRVQQQSRAEISPGKNKAVLTLADGRTMVLPGAGVGQVAVEQGVSIQKSDSGQLRYASQGFLATNQRYRNTISIPKGGQYQVILPDGTKVWLNASSRMIYPISFSGAAQRIVELQGEAYFEVAKDAPHPFIVKSDGQLVKVLGTHFNISSYPEDHMTTTTLVEGVVEVSRTVSPGKGRTLTRVRLLPGQQSKLSEANLSVATVNTEGALAWKDGYFMFDNEPLQSVMDKISRWYDVKVIYQDAGLKQVNVYGSISRFSDISELLHIIELTGAVKFKLVDRKLFVLKN